MTMNGIEPGINALRQPLEGCVDASSTATPEALYEALADLHVHLEWAGERQPKKMRMLTMEAPPGLATAGTEFTTTGADPGGMFTDRSVVTEASPGRIFEFVTEAVLSPKSGGTPVEWTVVHRYEIATDANGAPRISYRYRITRISHLVGPLRLLKTPLAAGIRKIWQVTTRKGLRNLVAVAESRSKP